MKKITLIIIASLLFAISSFAQGPGWQQIATSYPEPYLQTIDNLNYGTAVAIDGDYAAITNPGYSSVDVRHYDGSSWNSIATLKVLKGEIFTYGTSISFSGDYIVLGTPSYSIEYGNNTRSCGAALVYKKPATGWEDMTETAILYPSVGNNSDNMGQSVSIDGDYIVVGAYKNDDNGIDAGAAYIYKKPVTGWEDMTETAKLLASDGAASDNFGWAVSIKGDIITVGAPLDDDSASNSGSAYIFEKPATGWENMTETVKINASDWDIDDNFGISVAIDNDVVVVGAYKDDEGNTNTGAAYIFEKPITGWSDISEITKLQAVNNFYNLSFGVNVAISGDVIVVGSNSSTYKRAFVFNKPVTGWANATEDGIFTDALNSPYSIFGKAVAISGDKIVIGAHHNSEMESYSGAAYLFIEPTTGWETANENYKALVPSTIGNLHDSYGKAVAIDGDYAVVSSYAFDNGRGRVWVFYYDGTNWNNIAELSPSVVGKDFLFGNSVDISGENIIVCTKKTDLYDYYGGGVYVYTRPLSGWTDMTETALLTASDKENYDYGYIAAIDNDVIVMGAKGDDDIQSASGAAYIFEKPSSGWVTANETVKLKASDAGASDAFGVSVAISGDYVAIGAYYDDEVASDAGAAYVFEKPVTGWADASQVAKLLPSDGAGGEMFGYSIDIDGDVVAVGAYYHSNIEIHSGAIYVFEKPTNGWENMTETAKLNDYNEVEYDNIGSSVSISGDIIVAGVPNNDYLGENVGKALVYLKKISGWENATQNYTITSNYININQSFGNGIDISDNKIIVGAANNTHNGVGAGAAFLYESCFEYGPTVNDDICIGSSISINGTLYNQAGVVEEIVPGSYGCDSIVSHNISVVDLPVVTANASSMSVCSGSQITLNGGGSLSYTWDNNVVDNVAFIPTDTTYTVIGNDGICEDTAQISISIIDAPIVTANSSETAVCTGSQVILYGTENTSYVWNNGVTDSIPFIPTTTQDYVVSVDDGTCTNTDTITVTVLDLPNLTANASETSLCEGDNLTLYGNGDGTFTWDNSVSDNVEFIPTSTTLYTVTADDGSCLNTDTITVFVYPYPVQPSIVLYGGQLMSTATTGNQWYFSTIELSGETGQFLAPASNGDYFVEVTENGCSIMSEAYNFTTTTINNLDINNFTIYPNPANNFVAIQNSESAIQNLEILDITGKILKIINNVNEKDITIDISNFSKGVYFVKVNTNNNSKMKKLIIE